MRHQLTFSMQREGAGWDRQKRRKKEATELALFFILLPPTPAPKEFHHTLARGVEGAHVEDVYALSLSKDLETLETGRLLEIGGDGAIGGTRSEKVINGLDLFFCLSAFSFPCRQVVVVLVDLVADSFPPRSFRVCAAARCCGRVDGEALPGAGPVIPQASRPREKALIP